MEGGRLKFVSIRARNNAGTIPNYKVTIEAAHHEMNPPTSVGEYKIVKTLAKSTRSEVYLGESKKHKKKVVLKKMDRRVVAPELIAIEVQAGKDLQHPKLVKFVDEFKDEKDQNIHFLVFEYIKGEDLFAFLAKNSFEDPFNEKEAKRILRQLVSCLQYVHEQGYIHHDIKLENIMLCGESKAKKLVRLIDFGLCEKVESENELSSSWCGSHDYVARMFVFVFSSNWMSAEVLQRIPFSGTKADVWSLGTVLYIMLYGELPFAFQTRSKAIVNGQPHPNIDFADHRLSSPLSTEAKELLAGMLQVDPVKRFSLEAVVNHKWVVSKSKSWNLFGKRKSITLTS